MFGDNKSVVDSSMTPNGKIRERHVALSFYRVRKYAAAGIVTYQFIDGKHIPEDALSKHWEHNDIWPTLKPILFLLGDNMDCFNNDSLE